MRKNWYEKVFVIDLRALALFRIATGLVILSDLAIRARDLQAHYLGDALVRGSGLGHFAAPFSIYNLSEALELRLAFYALTGLAATSFTLGYRCKVSASLLWVLLVSLYAQNPVVLSNGDTLAGLLLLWSIFLPVGGRWALDSRRRAEPLPRLHLSFAGACFLVQVALVLITSGLGKVSSASWTSEGTALQYALGLRGTVVGTAMLDLPDPVLRIANWVALAIELSAPLLFFVPIRRVRILGVVLGLSLMMGIAVTMNVGPLPLLLACGLLAFLPLHTHPDPTTISDETTRADETWPEKLGRAVLAMLCVWLIGTACLRSASALPWVAGDITPPGWTLARRLGLDQHWQMFARPSSRKVRLELRGQLITGLAVDPRFVDPTAAWDPPDDQSPRSVFEYRRLRIEEAMLTPGGASVRGPYVASTCRTWNRTAPEDSQMSAIELFAVWEQQNPGKERRGGKVPLGWVPCPTPPDASSG